MYMVILGTLLLALKILQVGPTANLSWWVVLAPFAVAVAWWAYADTSGLTKRREMEKMEEKKRNRRAQNMSALGLGPQGGRSSSGSPRGFRDAQATKIEDKRDRIRQKNKETLARSTRPAGLGGTQHGPLDSRH